MKHKLEAKSSKLSFKFRDTVASPLTKNTSNFYPEKQRHKKCPSSMYVIVN